MQFAKKGLNVVLISRSLFKLQNVAREIGRVVGHQPPQGVISRSMTPFPKIVELFNKFAALIIDYDF